MGSAALVGVLAVLVLGAGAASGATPGAPASTVAPVVRGSPGVGKTLTTDNGTWSTTATFAYQWLRCSSAYADCTDIPDATAATYVPASADVGHVLGALVTATDATGSASALSTGTGPVEAMPPGTRQRPAVKGPTKVGHRIYETGDQWTRSPYRFTNHWLRCAIDGSACVRITGTKVRCANGSCVRVNTGTEWDYALTEKDAGHRIRAQVVASNGAGRATATSPLTRVVTR